MKKLDKFFITTLVAGLGLFTSALALPIEPAQALIGTNQIENNAITSPKIRDGEVKTPDIANGALHLQIHFVTDSIVLEVGQQRGFVVRCPSGEQVTGGGYNSDPDMPVYINQPNEAQQGIAVGWAVGASNNGNQPHGLTAFVMCAQPFP